MTHNLNQLCKIYLRNIIQIVWFLCYILLNCSHKNETLDLKKKIFQILFHFIDQHNVPSYQVNKKLYVHNVRIFLMKRSRRTETNVTFSVNIK